VSAVLASIKKAGAASLVIQPSPFTYRERTRLINSAINYGLATIVAWPPMAREGALIAFGPDYADMYRRAASYVERIIIKNTNPADLPVQEPVRFDLVINLKTAKALGIHIPPSILARADQVIE
jgi:putative ABC transport system substrate-binding protein